MIPFKYGSGFNVVSVNQSILQPELALLPVRRAVDGAPVHGVVGRERLLELVLHHEVEVPELPADRLGDLVDVRLLEVAPLAGGLRFEMLSSGQPGDPGTRRHASKYRRRAGNKPRSVARNRSKRSVRR